MDDLNPYQPPAPTDELDASERIAIAQAGECWRDGNLLVTTLRAQLPPRCVVTNQQACQQITLTCFWFPGWSMLGIFLGPLVIITLAMGCRAVKVHLSLSQHFAQRRRQGIRSALVFAGVALLATIVTSLGRPDWFPWPLFGGSAAVFFAVQYALVQRNVLVIDRVSETHVWLAGAGNSFLSQLPAWVKPM